MNKTDSAVRGVARLAALAAAVSAVGAVLPAASGGKPSPSNTGGAFCLAQALVKAAHTIANTMSLAIRFLRLGRPA